jgi:predicted transglutaminase-like cysteine proteinase
MTTTTLSKEEIKKIAIDVHHLIFSNFTYKTDKKQYGVIEKWIMPNADYDGSQKLIGDCEDFALAARKLLREKGIETRLVHCNDETGEGHMVLSVNGWIIDNRQKKVLSNTKMIKLGYEFLNISGTENGEAWHQLKRN